MKEALSIALQLAVGLAILNVWLLRKDKPTPWRAKEAKSMSEEFAVYGLPKPFMLAIGAAKLALALALIVGIWVPLLTPYAAAGLCITLLAAVIAHLIVRDPLKKSLPAATLLAMSAAVIII